MPRHQRIDLRLPLLGDFSKGWFWAGSGRRGTYASPGVGAAGATPIAPSPVPGDFRTESSVAHPESEPKGKAN